MSAAPDDMARRVTIRDHADWEHEGNAPQQSPQAAYEEARRELVRLERKEHELMQEVWRLRDMARWARYRIDGALERGAVR